jgi:hypothetical protein
MLYCARGVNVADVDQVVAAIHFEKSVIGKPEQVEELHRLLNCFSVCSYLHDIAEVDDKVAEGANDRQRQVQLQQQQRIREVNSSEMRRTMQKCELIMRERS